MTQGPRVAKERQAQDVVSHKTSSAGGAAPHTAPKLVVPVRQRSDIRNTCPVQLTKTGMLPIAVLRHHLELIVSYHEPSVLTTRPRIPKSLISPFVHELSQPSHGELFIPYYGIFSLFFALLTSRWR